MTPTRELLEKVRESALAMALLKSEDKNDALESFARLLETNADFLLQENAKDLAEQKGKISEALYSRLKLDMPKITTLAQGCRDLIKLREPIGQVTLHRELDRDLVLQRITVPLGVVAVVFESRPDVIPQILSLILKSGNAAILKGGREAQHSNRAMMSLVAKLNKEFSFFPQDWAALAETREDFQKLLEHEDLIDLVVPRGSGELVRTIKAATRIPVMGHADGVCHLYIHEEADLAMALKLAVDSKTQYPAACNSIETLLVDRKIASQFLAGFQVEAESKKMELIACEESRKFLPNAKPAGPHDWSLEYGDLRLSVKVVSGLEESMAHIEKFGSRHTDSIVTRNPFVAEVFLSGVDSAGVYWNASTRFADGFRYGFGAEVGVSTDKLHARGPVGIEGLITYKYKLRGNGQSVAEYVGPSARPFKHRDLD